MMTNVFFILATKICFNTLKKISGPPEYFLARGQKHTIWFLQLLKLPELNIILNSNSINHKPRDPLYINQFVYDQILPVISHQSGYVLLSLLNRKIAFYLPITDDS